MRDLGSVRKLPLWLDVLMTAMLVVGAVLEFTHGQYFFFTIFAMGVLGFGPAVVRRILKRE